MRNYNIIRTVFLFFNFSVVVMYGQVIDSSYVASYDSINHYYDLKKNVYQPGTAIFKSDVFNMGSGLGLSLIRTQTDDVGIIHRKYLQTLDDIPIMGSEFSVHENTGTGAFTANGNLLSSLGISSTPVLKEADAVAAAINADRASGGTLYFWEDTLIENELREDTGNPDTSYYPRAQLVVGTDGSGTSYYLSYKVRIYSKDPQRTSDYLIDAGTGSVIAINLISQSNCFSAQHSASAKRDIETGGLSQAGIAACAQPCNTGSATLKFYGSQNIYTDKFTYGILCRYRPKNTCTSTYIYVRKPGGGGDYRNSGNSWGTTDQSATSALWNFERTHDYFRFTLNRNSFDNASSQLNIYPEDPSAQGNAFWNGSSIHIGTAGSPFSDELLTLDVCGHEFTHGVTQYEAGLVYQGESGALNESFSDIFGIMVEYYGKQNYATGWTPNYQIGEETIGGGMRDMSNPNAKANPDTYNGTYWINPITGPDYGGVHTNSGVQNYWFYLLSEGGSGVNDNSVQYCVSGIGRDKASKIAYRNLTTYLSPNSNFASARFYSIQSAIDLYGAGSNEVAQTTAAWYAVGVGPQYTGPVLIQNLTINGTFHSHYNAKTTMQNVTVNNGPLSVSSNTEIELLPAIGINPGAYAELYIAPACAGGARMAGTDSGGNTDLSVAETEKNIAGETDFMILPNPNDGIFTLRFTDGSALPELITIRDVTGREVKTIRNPTAYEYEFNFNSLNSGLYFINTTYPDKILSKKFIKN